MDEGLESFLPQAERTPLPNELLLCIASYISPGHDTRLALLCASQATCNLLLKCVWRPAAGPHALGICHAVERGNLSYLKRHMPATEDRSNPWTSTTVCWLTKTACIRNNGGSFDMLRVLCQHSVIADCLECHCVLFFLNKPCLAAAALPILFTTCTKFICAPQDVMRACISNHLEHCAAWILQQLLVHPAHLMEMLVTLETASLSSFQPMLRKAVKTYNEVELLSLPNKRAKI